MVVSNRRATFIVPILKRSRVALVARPDEASLYLWLASSQRVNDCELKTYYKMCGEFEKGQYPTVYEEFPIKSGSNVIPKEPVNPARRSILSYANQLHPTFLLQHNFAQVNHWKMRMSL